MTWVLNSADVHNPTEAMVLAVMADRVGNDGRGCYYSHGTIAAQARVSVSTVQRTLRTLADRGIITEGDQQTVAHIRQDRRPVVWDLNMRPVSLTDRADSEPRPVRSTAHDRSPVTDETRPNPKDDPSVTRGETADGAPLGCAEHRDRRRSSCDPCMRVGLPALDTVAPASPRAVKAARDALRSA